MVAVTVLQNRRLMHIRYDEVTLVAVQPISLKLYAYKQRVLLRLAEYMMT